MIVILCSSCGRVGMIETPESEKEIACMYCGTDDSEWMSRPDLDNPTEPLQQIEKSVLETLHQAYEVSDYASSDANDREAKLKVILAHVENVPNTTG